MPLGGYHRPRFLRHALRDVERGHIAFGEAEEKIKMAVAEVIGVQIASGMRFVVDGMLDWHDIFRPFVESWRNVYPDGLLRYFDNNFFYRIPVFKGEPEPSKFILAPRVKAFKSLAEPSKFKVIAPGPLTFVKLSRNESGLRDEELAFSIAKVLNIEVRLATESGADAVQLDEPILTDPYLKSDDVDILNELVDEVFKGVSAFKVLATYFGVPNENAYNKIIETGVDAIAISTVERPKAFFDLIKRFGTGGKVPVLGVVDSRNIYDDDYKRVRELIETFIKTEDSEEIAITTSSWLDLIPFTYSLRKTIILGRYAEMLARDLGLELLGPFEIA
jgi:5-methyltetrahydropteroyltriglutamate--homocysteine methyltransferase